MLRVVLAKPPVGNAALVVAGAFGEGKVFRSPLPGKPFHFPGYCPLGKSRLQRIDDAAHNCGNEVCRSLQSGYFTLIFVYV